MSVPFGGGKGAKQQWIENDFDRLDRFARIYPATNMDGPGDEAAEEVANRAAAAAYPEQLGADLRHRRGPGRW